MITSRAAALTKALSTIKSVQDLSTKTPAAEAVLVLSVDVGGTVTVTNDRPDSRFTITVADATGDHGASARTSFHDLRDALAAWPADTIVTVSTAVDDRTLVAQSCDGHSVFLENPEHPVTFQTVTWPADRRVDLGRAGLKNLSHAAAAEHGSAVDFLDSVVLRQRQGRVVAVATNRYVISANHVDTDGPAREGNPEAPVMIDPRTLTLLGQLPGPVTLTMSATGTDTSDRHGTGVYRLTAPTWQLERASLPFEYPNIEPLLDLSPHTIEGTVELSAPALRRAVSQADSGTGIIAVQWGTSPLGDTQLLLSSATEGSEKVAAVNARDVDGTATMDAFPQGRVLMCPDNLKKLAAGPDKAQISWGFRPGQTLPRMWIDHDHGFGHLIGTADTYS